MVAPAHRPKRPRRKVVLELRLEEARDLLATLLLVDGHVARRPRVYRVVRLLQKGIAYVTTINPTSPTGRER